MIQDEIPSLLPCSCWLNIVVTLYHVNHNIDCIAGHVVSVLCTSVSRLTATWYTDFLVLLSTYLYRALQLVSRSGSSFLLSLVHYDPLSILYYHREAELLETEAIGVL